MAAEPKWQEDFSPTTPMSGRTKTRWNGRRRTPRASRPTTVSSGRSSVWFSIGLGLAELLAPRAVGPCDRSRRSPGDHAHGRRARDRHRPRHPLGARSRNVGVGARRRRCDGSRAARRSHELARCRSAAHRRGHSRRARRHRARRLLRSTIDCVAIRTAASDCRDAGGHHQRHRPPSCTASGRTWRTCRCSWSTWSRCRRSASASRTGSRRRRPARASSGMPRSSTISRSGASAGARCRTRKSRTKAW